MIPDRPKARDDLTVVVLDGEAVIYVEDSGDLHHLNPTATIVFQLCDGTVTIPELASDIAAVFETDTAEIAAQVTDLVQEFGDAGLLDGVPKAVSEDEEEVVEA